MQLTRVQYPSKHNFSAILSICCRNIRAEKFKNIDNKLTELSMRYTFMYKNMSPSSARAECAA